MSVKIVVPGFTFTGPRILTDRIESDGSLLLVEPGNAVQPWAAGVPISGSTVPNLMAESATALGISGLPTYNLMGLTGNKGKVERTAKGALHGIVSQTNVSFGDAATLQLPDDLIAYMIANPMNQIYYSAWQRITRSPSTNQPPRLMIGTGDSVKMHTYWFRSDIRPAGAPERIAVFNQAAAISTGTIHQAITVGAWRTSVPGTPSEIEKNWKWGAIGSLTSSYLNALPSYALYRFYMEDLTVSGRTHNDVLAIDQALYAEAFAEGGRYFGDTFTDPATIP